MQSRVLLCLILALLYYAVAAPIGLCNYAYYSSIVLCRRWCHYSILRIVCTILSLVFGIVAILYYAAVGPIMRILAVLQQYNVLQPRLIGGLDLYYNQV